MNERYKRAIEIIRERRNPNQSVDTSIVYNGESYRWMAAKVREHSDGPSDYMALAAAEFDKIAEALDHIQVGP